MVFAGRTVALSTEERALLTTQLAEARVAYHKVMTGVSLEEMVDMGGDKARFSRANATLLKRYIADLAAQLAENPLLNIARPMRPTFGRL